MRIFRHKPSPAMVLSCVALLVALSGTGIAAVNALPRNSVGNAQLQANSVTSIKVKNGSLLKVDFKAGQLPAGRPGPQGPAGATGPQGAQGIPGVVGDLILHQSSVNVPGDASPNVGTFPSRSVQTNCDPGEKGITGGTNWQGESDTNALYTLLSTPVYDAGSKRITAWRARGGNETTTTKTFQVYLLCTKA